MRVVKLGDPIQPIELEDGLPEDVRSRITAFFDDRHAGVPLFPPGAGDQDSIAKSLGFNDYQDYLQSQLWLKIKGRVLRRDERLCRSCGGAGDRVHHRRYTRDVLEGDDDEQLVSVCEGCHGQIHLDDSGVYRSESESETILQQGIRRTDYPPPKVDLRRKRPLKPPEWPRMTAVQRKGWSREYDRIWNLRQFRRTRSNVYRSLLRDRFGMTDAEIDSWSVEQGRGRS